MEIHAGGNQGGGGDEKQLIDLEWPNLVDIDIRGTMRTQIQQ